MTRLQETVSQLSSRIEGALRTGFTEDDWAEKQDVDTLFERLETYMKDSRMRVELTYRMSNTSDQKAALQEIQDLRTSVRKHHFAASREIEIWQSKVTLESRQAVQEEGEWLRRNPAEAAASATRAALQVLAPPSERPLWNPEASAPDNANSSPLTSEGNGATTSGGGSGSLHKPLHPSSSLAPSGGHGSKPRPPGR